MGGDDDEMDDEEEEDENGNSASDDPISPLTRAVSVLRTWATPSKAQASALRLCLPVCRAVRERAVGRRRRRVMLPVVRCMVCIHTRRAGLARRVTVIGGGRVVARTPLGYLEGQLVVEGRLPVLAWASSVSRVV